MNDAGRLISRSARTREVMAAALAAAGLAAAIVSTTVTHAALSDVSSGLPACTSSSSDGPSLLGRTQGGSPGLCRPAGQPKEPAP